MKQSELVNKINTGYFDFKNLLFYLFFKQFERIGVLIYYLVMIVHFCTLQIKQQQSDNQSQEDLVMYILPLSMHYVLQIAKAFYFDYQKMEYDKKTNNREVTRYRRLRKEINSGNKPQIVAVQTENQLISKEPQVVISKVEIQKKPHSVQSGRKKEKLQLYENIQWQQLEVGDLIYLKRNEVCPADILIIDVSDDIVGISTQQLDGQTQEDGRQPTQLTMLKNGKYKAQGFDYKKILTGQIQFDKDSNENIFGYIKLKKDPKGENFNRQNVVRREEQLKTCQYLIGLVLFVGQKCVCYDNLNMAEKKSFFVQKSRMFFALTLTISIIITFISWLVASFKLCRSEYEEAVFDSITLVFYMIQYLKTTPIYFYNCIDLIEMGYAHFKYRRSKYHSQFDYRVKGGSNLGGMNSQNQPQQTINYQQLNSVSIGDLVMTEYVCFDKTGTLTSGDFRVRSIIIEDMMYKFSQKKIQNGWQLYKDNFNQQLKQNPNFRIPEQEENSDEQIAIDQQQKLRNSSCKNTIQLTKSINKSQNIKQRSTFLHQTQLREEDAQNNFNNKIQTFQPLQQSGLLSKSELDSANVKISDGNISELLGHNIVENLKPEDLDDTHCKITPELKGNKPKPFFNKSIVNQSLSIQQSPSSSPFEEIQLMQVEEKQSMYSDKQKKPRSDSDATKKDELRQIKKQSSFVHRNNKFQTQFFQFDEEQIEIAFYKDQEFYQKLVCGPSQMFYQEAILSLLLCQEVISKFTQQEDQFIHDSTSHLFDQELMRFANFFDFKFICTNEQSGKITYIIEILKEIHEFQILAINQYSHLHPRLGVLIQYPDKLAEQFQFSSENEQEDELINSVLIVREEFNQIPAYVDIDKSSREYWDRIFLKLHMTGMRTVVYSKVYLRENEKAEFLDRYQELKFSQSQNDLIQLFHDIEKDMQIMHVLGIKEKIRPDAKVLIQQMRQADLSLFLLSGDDLNRVLPVAYKSKLLSTTDQLLYIDSDNAKLVIKNQLAQMAQQLQANDSNTINTNTNNMQQSKALRLNTLTEKYPSKIAEQNQNQESQNKLMGKSQQMQSQIFPEIKAYSIILSGEQFKLIQEDNVLLGHLIFLLYFCNSLIAYKFNAQEKAEIIKIIQTQFQGNKKVLAVGDSFNDIQMFRKANMGIQLFHIPTSYQTQKMSTKLKMNQRFSMNKIMENPLKKVYAIKDVQKMPTSDICINNFEDLCGLMFFESRIFAEVYDDLLVFSFYRSLLILYSLFLMYSTNCAQNYQLIEGGWLTVYQSLMLILQQIASLISKLNENYHADSKMYQEQFKINIKTFKKKKVISFVFKINGNALLDAMLLWLSYYTLYQNNAQIGIIRQMLLLLLIGSDIVKLCVSTVQKMVAWIILLFAYLVCWLSMSLLSVKFSFDENIETFEGLFDDPNSWFVFFFYIFAQLCLSSCIEVIQPLFCQSLIKSEKSYEEISQIQSKINGKKNTNKKKYHNLIKRIAVIAGKIFKRNNDDLDISIQEMVSGSNLKVNQDKVNPFTLKFMNKDTEMKFKRLSKILWLKLEKYKSIFTLLFLEIIAIILYVVNNLNQFQTTLYFMTYILGIALEIALLSLVCSNIYPKHFFFINLAIVSIRCLIKFICDVGSTDTHGIYEILITQNYIVIVLQSRVHLPIVNFILVFISMVGFLKKFSVIEFQFSQVTYFAVINGDIIAITTCILFMALQYKLIRLEREDFMLDVTLNQETSNMTNVLSILLPKFIRDRINAKGMFEIAENQGNVSIVFCDICGFDDLITIEKENIVKILDGLFRQFDQLCTQNGMQKIETVGKTYMAAGGLKAVDQGTKFNNQNCVKRAVQLSLEMMEHTKKVKYGQIGYLTIKIGVHYGRVIAGVIGHHKPQFSLIGDTVNTTSRVCSTGQDGQVTLSSEAYQEINMPDLQFTERKVAAKGKGELITYQVSKDIKRNTDKKNIKKRGVILKNEESNQIVYSPQTSLMIQQQAQVYQTQTKQPSYFAQNSQKRQNSIIINKQDEVSLQNQQQDILQQFSSKQSIPAQQDSSQESNRQQEQVKQFRRKTNTRQTLLMRGLPQATSTLNQIKINSNQNIQLENEQDNSCQDKELQQSYLEKSNLLSDISQKLRRELQIDQIDDYPDFDIEFDKIKGYLEDDSSNVISECLQLERKKLYLGFKDHQYQLAIEFKEQVAEGRNIVLITIYLHFLQYLAKTFTLFIIWQYEIIAISQLIIVIRLVSALILLMLALSQNKKLKHKFYNSNYFLGTYILLLFSILLEFIMLKSEELIELQASEGILLLCFFCSFQIIEITQKLIFLLVFCFTQILIVLIKFHSWPIAYYTIFQGILMFSVHYNMFYQDLNTFNNKRSLGIKKSQSENLVKYLLPNHILKQFLSNNQRVFLVEQLEDATLLFADIAGFTEYSSKVEPEQVVNMLRNLFTEFDKQCLTQNTYKLYTIGDCYVALGIIDIRQRNPAQEAKNVVELGFGMIEIIRNVRQIIGFDGLDMRIGIHTGRVIAGILGTEIVRYDVYGADVMISNKMESNGEKGRVQVSEETKQLLESQYPESFNFIHNKLIEFKSINRQTHGYFVEKNDSGFEESHHQQSGRESFKI
ncbi:unnamed protein product (macronuclear) [Paramecium tetraurelia]|uniref:adenylate cyclase n=1 Tax=Paramecium tetraurelia TaxID=5888 RepID=A0CF34_PARTE|nr:uncharacterized protein GSPATT00037840001 [Paramecium tetraurelia]CAK69401.1 unnamed protein product [Paramecium tetraurelia]|eukprot:XP_001436798.1 hypothetical protein (macronuclear) [Paramecium tetraurelia strain d4-2]